MFLLNRHPAGPQCQGEGDHPGPRRGRAEVEVGGGGEAGRERSAEGAVGGHGEEPDVGLGGVVLGRGAGMQLNTPLQRHQNHPEKHKEVAICKGDMYKND